MNNSSNLPPSTCTCHLPNKVGGEQHQTEKVSVRGLEAEADGPLIVVGYHDVVCADMLCGILHHILL